MSFSSFINNALLLEGGRAIKDSVPLNQPDALELYKHVTAEIGIKTALVGSAGKKPKGAQSGDVDVAVAGTWDEVERWAKSQGTIRQLKSLGILSLGIKFAGALRQVDLIPTENLPFTEWAYWNDKTDLEAGLKGSHRNELLFACGKHMLDEGRYILVLNKGLEKRPERELVAKTPKEVCMMLLGTPSAIMNMTQAANAFLSDAFPAPDKRKQIVQTFFKGLEAKDLSTDHPALERLQQVG